MIPLFLITGFLGSGKTTLLKRLAAQNRDRRWVYLVNDFGSVDVDGELVRSAGDRVVALPGGSIFCRCLVTDFIRTLTEISEEESGAPEAVVIEASGMADPRVIRSLLEETRQDRVYALRRIVALADPGTFFKLLRTLPNIRTQIESADTVLITKADRYPPEAVAEVEQAVRKMSPDAECRAIVTDQFDLDLFAPRDVPRMAGELAPCRDPHYHRFTLTESLPDRVALEQLIRAADDSLYRVKGFIQAPDGLYRVDYSSSGLRVEPWDGVGPPPDGRLVCIARGEDGPAVEARWRSGLA